MGVEDYDGVGAKTAQNLKDAGFTKAMDIARKKPETLSDETGIGEKRCGNIIEQAREEVRNGNAFSTGNDVKNREDERRKITTSSDELDNLLGGGVPEGYITEFYGKNSSGKTQMSLQLSVNAQRPVDEGGLDQQVVFIDTEDTFTSERIEEMAEAEGMDPEEALENIFVAKPLNSDDQIEITKEARQMCSEEDVGLVVVDSIIAHLRSEYSGRGELTERQEKLGELMEELKSMAADHDVAVVITNQVHVDPGQQFGDPTKPVGGNILSHNATFIVYLQCYSKKKEKWNAQLRDSPNLPDMEVLFSIDEDGIKDF